MSVTARRYKILAHMFSRAIRNLDQIQNCSTAHACEFDQSKIDKGLRHTVKISHRICEIGMRQHRGTVTKLKTESASFVRLDGFDCLIG